MPARRFPLLCSLVATAALTATAATAQAAAELPQPVWETPQAVGTLDNAPVNVRATPQGRLIAGWELGQSFMVAVRDPGGDWRPQEPALHIQVGGSDHQDFVTHDGFASPHRRELPCGKQRHRQHRRKFNQDHR